MIGKIMGVYSVQPTEIFIRWENLAKMLGELMAILHFLSTKCIFHGRTGYTSNSWKTPEIW